MPRIGLERLPTHPGQRGSVKAIARNELTADLRHIVPFKHTLNTLSSSLLAPIVHIARFLQVHTNLELVIIIHQFNTIKSTYLEGFPYNFEK